MVKVHRDEDGVRVEGAHYSVLIHPLADWRDAGDPTLSIGVKMIEPEGRGWSQLNYDAVHRFAVQQIVLETTASGGDALHCLRASFADAPAYRAGFVLTLEPGMRALLETQLPRIECVTLAAAGVRTAVESRLARMQPKHADSTLQQHEVAAIQKVVTIAVLDGVPPQTAIRSSVLLEDRRWAFSDSRDAPGYAELGAALRDPAVMALLAQAASEVRASWDGMPGTHRDIPGAT